MVTPASTGQVQDHGGIHPNLVSLLAPQSFEAEQVKLLKAQILYRTAGVIPSPMAVTSVLPGEGKSFIAANLAVSLREPPSRAAHGEAAAVPTQQVAVATVQGAGGLPWVYLYDVGSQRLAAYVTRTQGIEFKGLRHIKWDLMLDELNPTFKGVLTVANVKTLATSQGAEGKGK